MKKMPMGHSEESKKIDTVVFIASINEDILHNILSRLPAKSFAFATCVNRSWKSVCDRVFSRPKIISAFSRNPNQLSFGEVIDKVLSEPIRPHFVIANMIYGKMKETMSLIIKRVGSRIPIIVSKVAGILGKEACNDEAGELMYPDNFAILLTIGYLPGMKVDVIPVIQEKEESEASVGDRFVMDIRNYVSNVSDHAAPACLILFGEDTHATEPILHKLDYAMPAETIIVGDQKGKFLYKRANESSDVLLHKFSCRVLAGLIFARDRHKPAEAGTIQFDTAISTGMSVVDLRYTAANVSSGYSRRPHTHLNAKRRGEAEVLNGYQFSKDIVDTLVLPKNPLVDTAYIGVTKRRKYSIGLEKKPTIMTSLVFHRVANCEEYISVEGAGIKTGDSFQVYFPDLRTTEASISDVSLQFRNIKSKPNKPEVIGGFVFAGLERGVYFFGRPNVEISPFLENFSDLRFGGIFCFDQIGRTLLVKEEEEEKEEEEGKKETCYRNCLHGSSSVYLIVTYTSSS